MRRRRLAYLPIVTYPDPPSEKALARAVEMAAILEAEISAAALTIHVTPVNNPLELGFLVDVPQMIRTTEEKSRDTGSRLTQIIGALCSERSVGCECGVDSVPLGDFSGAAVRARCFDVSLLPWAEGNSGLRALAEDIVFGSGRPAILLPEESAVGDLDAIAVAWDGGRVAARALADAMPFIGDAAQIVVLTVTDEKELGDSVAASTLVASLERRGLTARAETVEAGDASIATALQDHALGAGAGMLVMGGYGHSRLRDFVLGGATQGVLTDLRLPVLLSH